MICPAGRPGYERSPTSPQRGTCRRRPRANCSRANAARYEIIWGIREAWFDFFGWPTPVPPPAPSPPPDPLPVPIPEPILTRDQVAQALDAIPAMEKLDWRHSVVDLLKLLRIDSSLTARTILAEELGLPPHAGLAGENMRSPACSRSCTQGAASRTRSSCTRSPSAA